VPGAGGDARRPIQVKPQDHERIRGWFEKYGKLVKSIGIELD
jgi:hypothetical protein